MAEHDLKPGDLVKLKSGGPVMTYEGEGATLGGAICVWFYGNEMKRERFDFVALSRVETDNPHRGASGPFFIG